MDQAIKRKRQLQKQWKKIGCKEAYRETEKDLKRAVYAGKISTEERFGEIFRREDSRKEVAKIAKQMKAENYDVIGDKHIKDTIKAYFR